MARTRTVKTDKGLYRIQSKDLPIQKMGLPERDSGSGARLNRFVREEDDAWIVPALLSDGDSEE